MPVLVPQFQSHAREALPKRNSVDRLEFGDRVEAGVKPVVRNPPVEVVDVVQAYVAGEPVDDRRQDVI